MNRLTENNRTEVKKIMLVFGTRPDAIKTFPAVNSHGDMNACGRIVSALAGKERYQ